MMEGDNYHIPPHLYLTLYLEIHTHSPVIIPVPEYYIQSIQKQFGQISHHHAALDLFPVSLVMVLTPLDTETETSNNLLPVETCINLRWSEIPETLLPSPPTNKSSEDCDNIIVRRGVSGLYGGLVVRYQVKRRLQGIYLGTVSDFLRWISPL